MIWQVWDEFWDLSHFLSFQMILVTFQWQSGPPNCVFSTVSIIYNLPLCFLIVFNGGESKMWSQGIPGSIR